MACDEVLRDLRTSDAPACSYQVPASIALLLVGDERRRDRRRGRRLERAPAMAATVGVDETSSRELVTITASALTDRGRRAHAAATQAQPSGARARARDLQNCQAAIVAKQTLTPTV